MPTRQESLKIGIFLCDCGGTISRSINLEDIKERLKSLPDIVQVRISHKLCLEEGQEEIASDISNKDINRVVIAACSPEIHEHTFMKLFERIGLNPYLLSLANIREQCSWAHPGKEVTEKALVEVKRALNKARLLGPLERVEVSVNKDVLVVGGGLAGMHAAIKLSDLNLKATLIEKEKKLGGRLSEFASLYGLRTSPEEILASKLKAINESKGIEVLTSAKLLRLEGEMGNFTAKIGQDGKETQQNLGAVIIATGYETRFLSQIYGFEPGDNILTQSGLAEMLKSPEVERPLRDVGFILDFSDEHSRIQTILTLTNALALKERFGSEIYVFCKNLKLDGAGLERLYCDCRSKGVIFFKFRDELPKISKENGKIEVKVEDILLGREEVAALCDLLVVDEKLVPRPDFESLSSILNIGLGPGNFYQEDNIHLYPVDSARPGIFFAGNCHADLDLNRLLIDAEVAALGAYKLLSQGKITVEVEKVVVDPEKCRICLTCIRACPHDAIRIVEAGPDKEAAKIFDPACQGCGICTAICPAKAISFKGYLDEQIISELEVIGGRV